MILAVKSEGNNEVNNNQNMNNIIDWANVWDKEAVAQTATVDQQVVNDLFNGFITIPSEVVVKFRNDNGYLKMVVNMNTDNSVLQCPSTYTTLHSS